MASRQTRTAPSINVFISSKNPLPSYIEQAALQPITKTVEGQYRVQLPRKLLEKASRDKSMRVWVV